MKKAFSIAFRISGDRHMAEEITQEAFIKAYNSISTFRGEAGFGTWLHRIVVNKSLNALKSMKRRSEREFLDSAEEFTGTHHTGGNDVLVGDHIRKALLMLPILQRTTVVLRHIEGYSTSEVSSMLGCSEGTVKTHLFRGLRKLRESLSFLREEIGGVS
jgi:RNA polymerase sigma-70 factor (ECF subfamily)